MRTNVILFSYLCAASCCAQSALTLADLEKMALTASPSLRQSGADVRAAQGRALQAGLYPNPVLGSSGEHISGTPGLRGGTVGGFVEQRFVTAGKLGLARRSGEQLTEAATQLQQAERLRVLIAIRTLYYEALGGERLLQVRREMEDLAARTAKTARESANLGRVDRPDVIAAEVEAQRAALSVTLAGNALDRTWREIAAMVSMPSLQRMALAGDIEQLPAADPTAIERIYAENPDLRAANSVRASAELLVDRARVEKIPDVVVRGGVRYNNELVSGFKAGTEGFFDVGIQIPLFNRNQGALAAARAEAERARFEVDRQRQTLARRFAAVYRDYQDASAAAIRYRDQMIPAAMQAYDLYFANFAAMTAAYTQVLMTQRNLIQMREEYVMALIHAARATVELDGLLVSY